jgi:short subunit dehydrogenase-like uncharacterized protein
VSFLLYGAYGYTGELLAEEAVARGHRPVLAGRSEAKLRPLAERLGLAHVALDLEDEARLARSLDAFRAVLHAAGPFVHTGPPMMRACIAAGVHYLDITGEIGVLEQAFALDARARDRGVTVLPGVGFDVVPTDCLARHVADRVPGATRLDIAFAVLSRMSGGTARSTAFHAGEGGAVRRGGQLRPYPLGKGVRRVRFADRERTVMPIPWGDLATAYRTTGISDITTLTAVPPALGAAARAGWPLMAATRPLLGTAAGRSLLLRALRPPKGSAGPDAEQRRRGRSEIWARAEGPDGSGAEAWLTTLDGYELTRLAGIRAVERLLAGGVPAGTTTPALAFGADFVLELPGTTRLDRLPSGA